MVGIHILSQQNNLLESLCHKVVHLVQDALHIAASLASAGVGHNAVVAEVVASSHDGDVARNLAAAYAHGDDVAVCLCGRQFDVHCRVAKFGLCNELGKREVGVGAGHNVHLVALYELLLHALGHASHHANHCAFATARSVELVQAAIDFLFGIVAYRTGVEQYQVGLVNAVADVVARNFQYRANDLAVGKVHLATICLYEQFLVVFHFC